MGHFLDKSLSNYLLKLIDNTQESLQIKIPGKEFSSPKVLIDALECVQKSNQVHGYNLIIKIAAQYFDEWDRTYRGFVEEKYPQWIDNSGNLTRYRNQLASENNSEKSILLVIGFDYVDDQSSLAHFISADLNSVFNYEMKKSFKSWIGEMDSNCLVLLKDVSDFIDISTLDEFLKHLELADASSLFEEVGHNLYQINLPNVLSKKRSYQNSIKQALRIIDGSFAIEESNVKKATKAIDYLEQNFDENNKNAKELLDHPEYYNNEYTDVKDFIADCRKLLDLSCDDSVRDKIRKTDCHALVDLVYKQKKKSEKKKSNKEIRVTGLPFEAILSALWIVLTDQDEDEKISKVSIIPNKFCHNLKLSDQSDTSAVAYVYEQLIRPIFGGVDDILRNCVFEKLNDAEEISIFENTIFEMDFSEPYWNDYNVKATNSIPYCSFIINVQYCNDDAGSDSTEDEKYEFRYEYRNDSPVMYTLNLFNTVMEKLQKCTYELPVFFLDKYSEMYDKTDDEIGLFFASEVEKRDSIDVMDLSKFLPAKSSIKQDVGELYSYFFNYCSSMKDGLHYAIEKKSSEFCNKYMEILQKIGSSKDSDCGEAFFKQAFIRSFWIIRPIDVNNVQDVLSSSKFSDGIVTLLHPSMIDMLHAQVMYLANKFVPTYIDKCCENTNEGANANSVFEELVGYATLINPIPCMLDGDRKVTESRGSGLLYLLGNARQIEDARPASILCRYDEDITDSMVKSSSQQASLVSNMLLDYYNAYMMSKYSIRISIFLASDIQPIVSGIISFLKTVGKKKDSSTNPTAKQKYFVDIYFYSTLMDERNTSRWINTANDYFIAESQKEKSELSNVEVSFFVKVIEDADNHIINSIQLDSDVTFIYESSHYAEKTTNWTKVRALDNSLHGIKFPLATKLLPRTKSIYGSDSFVRKSLISNRQFEMYSRYINYVFSTRGTLDEESDVVIEEEINFSRWNKLYKKCIDSSERVVAIGSNIDKNLIFNASGNPTTIIGSGTGLGDNADLNYVVASKVTSYDVLKDRLKKKFLHVFMIPDSRANIVVNNMMKASDRMADLSLIKTISSKTLYCHDFFGYSMIRHILKAEDDCFTDVVLALDSYKHWFKNKNSKRADLLWVRAKLVNDGIPKFRLKFNIVESKLGEDVEHTLLAHAAVQASDTYNYLKERLTNSEDRYDSKYWWMQLHRIIASNSVVESDDNETLIKEAFENLSYGNFEVESFDRCAIAFEKTACYQGDKYRLFISKTNSVPELVITSEGIQELLASPIDETWEDFFSHIQNSSAESEVNDSLDIAKKQMLQEMKNNEKVDPVIDYYDSGNGESNDGFENPIYQREMTNDDISEIEDDDNEFVEDDRVANFSDEIERNDSSIPMDYSAVDSMDDFMDEDIENETKAASPELQNIENNEKQNTVQYSIDDTLEEPLENGALPKGTGLYASSDAKIPLGKDILGNSGEWLFGSDYRNMQNKHMLVIGGSGSGKSYAIKCILCELAKRNQHSIVIDYTEGFKQSILKEEADKSPHLNLFKYSRPQYIVKKNPMPINPFAMYQSNDEYGDEDNPMDVAIRVVDILNHAYSLGDVQKGLLMEFIEEKLNEYGNDFNMDMFGEALKEASSTKEHKNLKGVAGKLTPLYKTHVFDKSEDGKSIWDVIFNSDGTKRDVSILQFSNVPDIVTYPCVDFLLWDLFNYCKHINSREDTPHVVVLDEFQNLSLGNDSPVRKYLQEGRKFGLNLILATQTLAGIKQKDGHDAVASLFNAANILIFKPTPPDIKFVAQNATLLDPSHSTEEWENILTLLNKGECILFTLSSTNNRIVGRKIKITSMEER